VTATISSVRWEYIEEAAKVTRWNRRLLFGAIAVLVPVLAGCEAGNNAPTLEFHPASTGVSVVDSGIAIDNAFVLGPALNATLPAGGRAGVFLALQAQNGDRLVSVSAPGSAASAQIAGGSVGLAAQALVDMSGPEPEIVLTGLTKPLTGGQTIQLVLTFATVGPVTLNVPVLPRAYDYATYSPPAIPAPTVTPKAHASASVSPSASGTASALPTGSPAGSPSATP
jgi:copper(I)-binding protein